MANIEQRVSYIEGRYATEAGLNELKAELHKALGSQLRWIVTIQLLGIGAVAAIVQFVGN